MYIGRISDLNLCPDLLKAIVDQVDQINYCFQAIWAEPHQIQLSNNNSLIGDRHQQQALSLKAWFAPISKTSFSLNGLQVWDSYNGPHQSELCNTYRGLFQSPEDDIFITFSYSLLLGWIKLASGEKPTTSYKVKLI